MGWHIMQVDMHYWKMCGSGGHVCMVVFFCFEKLIIFLHAWVFEMVV